MTKKELIEFLMNPEIPDDAAIDLEGFDNVLVLALSASYDDHTNAVTLRSCLV